MTRVGLATTRISPPGANVKIVPNLAHNHLGHLALNMEFVLFKKYIKLFKHSK